MFESSEMLVTVTDDLVVNSIEVSTKNLVRFDSIEVNTPESSKVLSSSTPLITDKSMIVSYL